MLSSSSGSWRRDDPIVDLRLLANRNFAIANLLMFMLGFILLGQTVLLPQLVQQLLGYTATAGRAGASRPAGSP